MNDFSSLVSYYREETEIIEGEVVEIQIDRPATGTVGCYKCTYNVLLYTVNLLGLLWKIFHRVHYLSLYVLLSLKTN